MLNWNEAFDKTLNAFKINATALAEAAGLSRPTISRFRHGKQPTATDTLNALLDNMPPEATTYFMASLLNSSGIRPADFIVQSAEEMSDLEILEIILMLSKKADAEKMTFINGEVAIIGNLTITNSATKAMEIQE